MQITKKHLAGVLDIELAFPTYDKENNYLVHNIKFPFPEWLKRFSFDAILVTSTFLDHLTFSSGYTKIKSNYGFLRDSQAVKIAFPQDDYWCSENRDLWYVENRFDLVYPVCQENSWQKLIPKFIEMGGVVKQGYTTYVTPSLRKYAQGNKDYKERFYDVVYRAKGRPAYPNKLGDLKSTIGQTFIDHTKQYNLNLDISTKEKSMILGKEWFNFLGNSRATIATPSGSSLRVKNLKIAECLLMHSKRGRSFTEKLLHECEVRDSDLDTEYVGLSPRVLEAAATKTVQIMVSHRDEKILRSHTDYVVLDPSCTNVLEIVKLLKDGILLKKIAESCWNRIQSSKELDIQFHIDQTIDFINKRHKILEKNKVDFGKVVQKHKGECEKNFRKVILYEYIRKSLRDVTPDSIKNIVRSIRIKS